MLNSSAVCVACKHAKVACKHAKVACKHAKIACKHAKLYQLFYFEFKKYLIRTK